MKSQISYVYMQTSSVIVFFFHESTFFVCFLNQRGRQLETWLHNPWSKTASFIFVTPSSASDIGGKRDRILCQLFGRFTISFIRQRFVFRAFLCSSVTSYSLGRPTLGQSQPEIMSTLYPWQLQHLPRLPKRLDTDYVNNSRRQQNEGFTQPMQYTNLCQLCSCRGGNGDEKNYLVPCGCSRQTVQRARHATSRQCRPLIFTLTLAGH